MKVLEEKVALVTGGARGIGRAIGLELAAAGAAIAVADIDHSEASRAAAELREQGFKAGAHAANVALASEAESMIREVLEEHGRIDILVNNAGITRDNLIMRMKESEWDSVIAVNLKGVFNCLKAVTRPMIKARGGKIINIASVVGIMGNAGQANYSASKAGVIGLTKSAAKELASRCINVNAVAPGYIQTDMTESLGEEARAAFLTRIPLARPGTPEDVARTVLFLAGPGSDYITGQTINIDGGMVM